MWKPETRWILSTNLHNALAIACIDYNVVQANNDGILNNELTKEDTSPEIYCQEHNPKLSDLLRICAGSLTYFPEQFPRAIHKISLLGENSNFSNWLFHIPSFGIALAWRIEATPQYSWFGIMLFHDFWK